MYVKFLEITYHVEHQDNTHVLSGEEQLQFHKQFAALDTDGDGLLNEEEALLPHRRHFDEVERLPEDTQHAERSYRITVLEEAQHRFVASDTNQDGLIDNDGWMAMNTKFYPEVERVMTASWAKLEVEGLLHHFDGDGDGVLNQTEVKQASDEGDLERFTHEDLKEEL